MAMNVGSPGRSSDPDVMIDINTTPLIDVMLVLLVMLIITIPIQLHSVNLNLPTGNPPPPLVGGQLTKTDETQVEFPEVASWPSAPFAPCVSAHRKLRFACRLRNQ